MPRGTWWPFAEDKRTVWAAKLWLADGEVSILRSRSNRVAVLEEGWKRTLCCSKSYLSASDGVRRGSILVVKSLPLHCKQPSSSIPAFLFSTCGEREKRQQKPPSVGCSEAEVCLLGAGAQPIKKQRGRGLGRLGKCYFTSPMS